MEVEVDGMVVFKGEWDDADVSVINEYLAPDLLRDPEGVFMYERGPRKVHLTIKAQT